jgi:Capsule polysaccharide biosynthesis protein
VKVLFFPLYLASPHLETDLELIANHMEKGDEIKVIKCRGELFTCFDNNDHYKSECVLCNSKVKEGLKLINFPMENIINLPKKKPNFDNLRQDFANVRELMDYKYEDIELGLAAASTLIKTHNKDHNFDTINYKDDVLKGIKNVYYLYNSVKNFLLQFKPDVFYFFNGRLSCPRALILACEKTKTPFCIHERSGKLGGYLIRKNTYPHDIYLVQKEIDGIWNKGDPNERVDVGHKWFQERRAGIEQSWYSYIADQELGKLPEGFDNSKKNVIIYSSTMEERYTLLNLQNNYLYQDEIEGVKQIATSLEKEENIHTYLRVHPNLKNIDNTQTRAYKEMQKKYQNLTVIPAESNINSYSLLDNADVVIVFASSVGLEACYSGKPVILGCESCYDNLNVAYRPKTHKDLINLIKSDLTPKNQDNALKYAFWEKNYGELFTRFKQTSLDSGEFLGKRIGPSKSAWIKAGLYKIFEIKSFTQLKEIIQRRIFRKRK